MWSILWSMGNLAESTSSAKMMFPPPSNYVANGSTVTLGPGDLLSHLYWPCADNHSCHESKSALTTSCPEDSISQYPCPFSGSYILVSLLQWALMVVGLIQMSHLGRALSFLSPEFSSYTSLYWLLSTSKRNFSDPGWEQLRTDGLNMSINS